MSAESPREEAVGRQGPLATREAWSCSAIVTWYSVPLPCPLSYPCGDHGCVAARIPSGPQSLHQGPPGPSPPFPRPLGAPLVGDPAGLAPHS